MSTAARWLLTISPGPTLRGRADRERANGEPRPFFIVGPAGSAVRSLSATVFGRERVIRAAADGIRLDDHGMT